MCVRFCQPHAHGDDQGLCPHGAFWRPYYIGAANFGYMVFDGGVTLVLLLIGGLLLRRYIGSPKGQMTAYVVAVVVVILGINAGLM